MRHAILGAGGVGGLIGGALARTGAEVLLLLRPETLARHPRTLRVESVVLGDFKVGVATASRLDREPDVLRVTPKATQLESALKLAPATVVGDAVGSRRTRSGLPSAGREGSALGSAQPGSAT